MFQAIGSQVFFASYQIHKIEEEEKFSVKITKKSLKNLIEKTRYNWCPPPVLHIINGHRLAIYTWAVIIPENGNRLKIYNLSLTCFWKHHSTWQPNVLRASWIAEYSLIFLRLVRDIKKASSTSPIFVHNLTSFLSRFLGFKSNNLDPLFLWRLHQYIHAPSK